MKKLDSFFEIEDTTQITIKIHKNYLNQKENTFRNIDLKKKATFCSIVSFCKVVERVLETEFDSKIYVRYWRNVRNPLEEAYTIAVNNASPSVINTMYKGLHSTKNIKFTQSINIRQVLSFYSATCTNNTSTFGNSNVIDEEEEELNFCDVFSFENTKTKLGLNSDSVESQISSEDVHKTFQNQKIDIPPVREKYVPVYDFLVIKPDHFFWEAFGKARFPWLEYNTFEKESCFILNKHAESQGIIRRPVLSLRILHDQFNRHKVSWLTQTEIEEKEIEMNYDDNDDSNLEQDDGEEERRKKKKKKKAKKRLKPPDKQYWDKYFIKYHLKDIEEKEERVNKLNIKQLGARQDLKHVTEMLAEIIKNKRELYKTQVFANDEAKEAAKKALQDDINELVNDFWSSYPVQTELPKALKGLYKKFMGERKQHKFLITSKSGKILGNHLERFFRSSDVLAGLKNTKLQFTMQIVSRDGATCTYNNLQLPVYISGVAGSGKSYTMGMVYLTSCEGTMDLNTIVESAKAGLGKINPNDFSTKIQTDAGPIFTQRWSQLNSQQKEQIKGILSELSESYKGYHVFINNGDRDPLKARESINIFNYKRGPTQIIGNGPLNLKEAIDRFYNISIGYDPNKMNTREDRAAADIFKSDEVHSYIQKLFFDHIKQMQADVGIYFVFEHVGATPVVHNLTTALLIANFCLNKIKEKCPFFVDSSRKFIHLNMIAKILGAYKNKILLTDFYESKYYGQKYITDIAEFCFDMSKRMIIGYEEIVPALFLMMPQYIDSSVIDILQVFKTKILKIEGDLSKPEYMKRYFKDVICDKANLLSNGERKIDFKSIGNSNSSNNNSSSSSNFYFTTNSNSSGSGSSPLSQQENNSGIRRREASDKPHVDTNFIVYTTELSQDYLALEIQKHLKTPISPKDIKDKINEMRTLFDVTLKYLYGIISVGGDIFQNIYDGPGTFSVPLPKKNEETIKNKVLFFQHNKNLGYYQFPTEIFRILDKFKSGYDTLKDIIVNDLPFKNQAESEFYDTNIVVTAINPQTLKTETLEVKPHEDSPENFKIRNPKKMTGSDRVFYKMLKEHNSDEVNKLKSSEFYNKLIKHNYLIIDHSLRDLGYKNHQEGFGFSVEDMDELIEEEENLIGTQLEFDKLQKYIDMFNKSKVDEKKKMVSSEKIVIVDAMDVDEEEEQVSQKICQTSEKIIIEERENFNAYNTPGYQKPGYQII